MNAYEHSKNDIDLISDQENEEKIDENNLNELDMEVSNYLNDFGNDNQHSSHKKNQVKRYHNSKMRLASIDILTNEPELNFKLIDENENKKKIIAEYQLLCKDYEKKIAQTQEKITELEEKIKTYKDENEQYKDDMESLQFQLKLACEREIIREENFVKFKELQNEYENQSIMLNSDIKAKEDGFKKKLKKMEDALLNQMKSQENEYEEKIAKLTVQIKEYKHTFERYEKDIEKYKEKNLEYEKIIIAKEKEYDEVIYNKDKKLQEFEQCIKSISDEANSQINKLSENVEEFSEKINIYKQRELQITQDYLQLQKQLEMQKCTCFDKPNVENQKISMKSFTKQIRTDTSLNQDASVNLSNKNLSPYDKQKLSALRTRINELENETTTLTRELQLKCEECDCLNDELRKISADSQKNEKKCLALLQSKDEEIFTLKNKINELDILVNNYGNHLQNIKASYDKCLIDHKRAIKHKNAEMKALKEHYDKKIRELHLKIEEILFTEKAREVTLGIASLPVYLDKSDKEQYHTATPNVILEDEIMKNSINNEINRIKEKLDKYASNS